MYKQTGDGEERWYHYQPDQQLQAELDSLGQITRGYLWLNHQLVGMLDFDTTRYQAYAVITDHLGTPRQLRDHNNQTVWQWQGEAIGATAPNQDPDNNGLAVEFNLRFPGQYHDRETGLFYNYFRYYDPGTGRYLTSDPIGLQGGLNTYAYALSNPIRYFDPDGLEVRFVCWKLAGLAQYTGMQHCFVHVTCPQEGWARTFSLFGAGGSWPSEGYKAQNDPRDNPNSPNNTFNQPIDPKQCFADECAYEKAVVKRYQSFPSGNVPYSPFGPNSISFAQDLATGTPFGGQLPPGAPGPVLAPGIGMPHPNFP